MATTLIHIEWEGPFTIDEVKKLTNGYTDYGLYQIYGPNPTYCRVELLYIGLADAQTFAVRIPQHAADKIEWRDSSQALIYVGRLAGNATPDNATWTKEIYLAERLLIYAHYPVYNKTKDLGGLEPELRNVQVLNWKRFRDLFPEVSGVRFCRNEFSSHRAYGTHRLTSPDMPQLGQGIAENSDSQVLPAV